MIYTSLKKTFVDDSFYPTPKKVRIFGYGFSFKDVMIHELLFSQRNGYTKSLTIGNWIISTLKPNNFTAPAPRTRSDFGQHPADFEHICCFVEQIEHIGKGTKYGNGEEVIVKMQSGKFARFILFSMPYNVWSGTGQKNWRYHFVDLV